MYILLLRHFFSNLHCSLNACFFYFSESFFYFFSSPFNPYAAGFKYRNTIHLLLLFHYQFLTDVFVHMLETKYHRSRRVVISKIFDSTKLSLPLRRLHLIKIEIVNVELPRSTDSNGYITICWHCHTGVENTCCYMQACFLSYSEMIGPTDIYL